MPSRWTACSSLCRNIQSCFLFFFFVMLKLKPRAHELCPGQRAVLSTNVRTSDDCLTRCQGPAEAMVSLSGQGFRQWSTYTDVRLTEDKTRFGSFSSERASHFCYRETLLLANSDHVTAGSRWRDEKRWEGREPKAQQWGQEFVDPYSQTKHTHGWNNQNTTADQGNGNYSKFRLTKQLHLGRMSLPGFTLKSDKASPTYSTLWKFTTRMFLSQDWLYMQLWPRKYKCFYTWVCRANGQSVK